MFYFHGISTVDPDEGQVTKDPELMSASAKSEWSQSDTDISNVEERMYQSGRSIPNLQACIEEKEFNLKLAEEKKKVSAIQFCRCQSWRHLWQLFYFKWVVSSLEDSWIYNLPMHSVVTSVSVIPICCMLDSIQLSVIKGQSWPWSYGSWIYNYLCNQYLSQLKLSVQTPFMARWRRYNIMW